jgi:hypothetical protein
VAVEKVFRQKITKTKLRQDELEAILSKSKTFPVTQIFSILAETGLFQQPRWVLKKSRSQNVFSAAGLLGRVLSFSFG